MTQERITLVDSTESWTIRADEGMTLIRTADGIDFGKEVTLGYRYRGYDGSVLDEPVLELPEDFHEEESTEEYEEFEEVQ